MLRVDMRLLIDAHLPKRLARLRQQLGHDALYTLDLRSRIGQVMKH